MSGLAPGWLPIRLSDPLWLALVALAVPTLWLGVRWLLGMSAARRATVITSRTLLLTLLALALAGAASPRSTEALAIVAVIDVSDSAVGNAPAVLDELDPQAGAQVGFYDALRRFLAGAANNRETDDRLGIVLFDGVAVATAMPSRSDPSGRSLEARYLEGTDIGQAIRLASAMLPADASGRLLLVSDGNQTSGDAIAAAAALDRAGSLGVPVDVMPIDYRIQREVIVDRVDVPPSAVSESVITVRVLLRSTAPASGRLSLLYDGLPVDINGSAEGTSRPLTLGVGQRVESADVVLDPSRVHRFEAVWEPSLSRDPQTGAVAPVADAILRNNRARAFTITPGAGSVLIVRNAPGETTLERTLRDAGLDVLRLDPASSPTDLLGWQGYDLVVLDDVPAEALPVESKASLVTAVSEFGTGLVMVGGRSSFGAGGWQGSPIEPILPVSLDVPDRLVMPRVALMLVLDSSGSMGRSVLGSARSQQTIANQAAARAVSSLSPTDLVGVIRFSNDHRTVLPLGPNDDADAIGERIRSIRSGGGTNLPPALRAAGEALQRADAELKHIIVLSDGRSQNVEQLPTIARELAESDITVTAISVGDEADASTLRQVAVMGGGTFYEVIDPNRLPGVFLSAVRIVRSPLIREERFVPQRLAASPLTDPIASPVPPLEGLVLTSPRDEPGVVTSLATPDGMPVLAEWQVGLGRVAAFTSDSDQWASAWLQREAYRAFWVRAARTLARPESERRVTLAAVREGRRVRLIASAYDNDGAPSSGLSIPATVYSPGGTEHVVSLTETAPGTYEASVPADQSGDYIALARPSLNGAPLPSAVGGVSVPAGAEYRALASDRALLEAIAQRTAGRVLEPTIADAQRLFDPGERPVRRAWLPLWPPLLVASLAVLLLDIATRRVAWDRWLSREFGGELAQQARLSTTDRSASAGLAMGTLRSARPASHQHPSPRAAEQEALHLVREANRARAAIRAQGSPSDPMPTKRATQEAADRGRTKADPNPQADPPPEDASSASGLLAAKRRAQRRYEEGD